MSWIRGSFSASSRAYSSVPSVEWTSSCGKSAYGPSTTQMTSAPSSDAMQSVPSIVFGMFGLAFFVYEVGGAIDKTFFSDKLPTPTFGTGGLLWASLTLALLTVPVVVVATREGLLAVPSSWRDGSLALGATRWQTLRRIILPAAMPGILTGFILAVSRAANLTAPVNISGASSCTSVFISTMYRCSRRTSRRQNRWPLPRPWCCCCW